MMRAVLVRPPHQRLVVADAGQSLLEFAITLPFLLLLLTGSIDFGRYMYDGIELGNGARAGAQYGSQNHGTETDITGMQQAATTDAQAISGAVPNASFCECGGGITLTAPVCATAAYTCPTDHVADYVTVTFTGTFKPLLRIPGLPSSLTITRSAIAQVSP